MSPGLPRQSHLSELFDGETLSPAQRRRMLAHLRRANLLSNAHPPIIAAVARLVAQTSADQRKGPLRIADIGAGSGDLARAITQWGRRRGVRLQVAAVEVNPVAAAEAAAFVGAWPEIAVLRRDFWTFDPGAPFDVVTALHFLHHLDDEAAAAALRRMAEMARLGIIVSDLYRSRLTWVLTGLLTGVISRCAAFRHDACVSVLRSFTADELGALARRAGLERLTARRVPGRRVLLTAAGMAG